MTTGGWLVLGVCALVVCVGVVVFVFQVAADWAIRRQDARDAAGSFECDFIPTAADIAPVEAETDEILSSVREAAAVEAAERVVAEEEMVIDLDAAIAHIEGLRQ